MAALLLGAGAVVVVVKKRRRPPRPADTRPPGPRPPVGTIYQVDPRLWVVPEGGGNTAVFETAKGLLLVDTKYAQNWDGLMAQIRSVTDKPVTHVINTHCHGDHTGGNVRLPPEVEIVVQEETAANLEEMREDWDPDDLHGRPYTTYDDHLTLFDGDDAVDLWHFGPAHTSGDTFVVFRKSRVMHAGDVFSGKAPPIVNHAWGGDGVGYAAAIGRAAKEIKDVDRVIPGHEPVCAWSDFTNYAEFNRILLEHAREQFLAGRTPEEARESLRLPATFGDYALDRTVITFYEIYKSLRR